MPASRQLFAKTQINNTFAYLWYCLYFSMSVFKLQGCHESWIFMSSYSPAVSLSPQVSLPCCKGHVLMIQVTCEYIKEKNEKAVITLMKWTREVLDRKATRLWAVAMLSFTVTLLLLTSTCLLSAAWLIHDHELVDAASLREHQNPHVEVVIHKICSSILNHTSDWRRVFAWR